MHDDSVRLTARHGLARRLMSEYRYAICMPLAQRSLHEIIQQERLASAPIGTISYVLLQIARALAKLHSDNYVHGDIKPRNIVRMEGVLIKLNGVF